MLRKLLTNLLILVVAAIPLTITLVNYKLNFDPLATGVNDRFVDAKALINDIAAQVTFFSIAVCILALSDYWDFRSDARSDQHGPSLPRFVLLQNIAVFFLSILILLNFILYYAEISSVTVVDFRFKKLLPDETDEPQSLPASLIPLVSAFGTTAIKFIIYACALLVSSIILYVIYFLIQTEQKLMARMFWSYGR